MAMQSSVETVTGGMVRRIGRFGQSLDDLGRQGDGATNALQPTQAELRWALCPRVRGNPREIRARLPLLTRASTRRSPWVASSGFAIREADGEPFPEHGGGPVQRQQCHRRVLGVQQPGQR